MHDDLIEVVNWVEKTSLTNPRSIVILSSSYGGYCAGGTHLHARGVRLRGAHCRHIEIADVCCQHSTYWRPFRSLIGVRLANVDDRKNAQLIRDTFPSNFAHRIVRHLWIGQGTNGSWVKQEETVP